jgi:hypothetical protein
MYELVVFGFFVTIVTVILLAIGGKCYGRAPPSGRARITRPDSKTVDGFGGARARDFAYMTGAHMGPQSLPVSQRTEREKTETWKASERNDFHRQ